MTSFQRLRPALVLTLLTLCSLPGASLLAQEGILFDTAPETYPTYGDLPGLCHLEFRFPYGDQHLKTMKGIPNLFGQKILFDLADNDHGQTVYGVLKWRDLSWNGSLRFASASNCRDGCWLNMPAVSVDQEFILAGIDLRFLGGDRHIRDIEVLPSPESGRIWVRFRDNTTNNPFNATIAYILVPRGHYQRSVSSSTNDEMADINRSKAVGASYLQGFKANFMNGDHHFEHLRVDVCDNRVRGTFHDGGGVDDPYRLEVRYVTFHP